jgi:hypothetical protein
MGQYSNDISAAFVAGTTQFCERMTLGWLADLYSGGALD